MFKSEVIPVKEFYVRFEDVTDTELLAIKDEANMLCYEFINVGGGAYIVDGFNEESDSNAFIEDVKERLEYWKTNKE